MDTVTIDFETYYDRDYSLSKLTTEEYVRSDDFEIIGVSVKVNDDPADWFSGSYHETKTFLNGLDYSDKAIICHNTAFDGAILSWRMGINPRLWIDTLSMARPLHGVTVGGSLKALADYYGIGQKGEEVVTFLGYRRKDFSPAELAKYGNYCANDATLTYKLFRLLARNFPTSEMMVIDQTIRMYTEPKIELNWTRLQKHLDNERTRKKLLLEKLGDGDPIVAKKVLNSNVKFAALLASLGAKPPTKISKTTGKTTFAFAKTDPGMKELLNHPEPAVRAVSEVRLGTKSSIEETRTERLIEVSKRGPLPILLKYYGAHTGRFSGGDKLNLQNLPSRSNNIIRSALCAPYGHKLIACDSSQIEARVLAYMAGQMDLVEAFRKGEDVYRQFAARIYNIPEEEVTDKQRFVGKTCILGLGYQMGWQRFAETIRIAKGEDIGEVEAKRIVYLYRNTYQKIAAFWDTLGAVLSAMSLGQSGMISDLLSYGPEGIKLPNGMHIKFNGLQPNEDNTGFVYISDARVYKKFLKARVTGDKSGITWTNIYGGKVAENIIQALARIIVVEQMVEMGQCGYPVAFQVHDENISCVPNNIVSKASKDIERIMSQPPSWAPGIPVACELAVGDNYGECK